MKKNKIIVLVLMVVVCQIIFTFQINNIKYRVDSVYDLQYYSDKVESRTRNQPKISTCKNIENIEAVFDRKLSDYELYGYFPQIYEPSLQATYYGLYILDALGRLGEINKTAITTMEEFIHTMETTMRLISQEYSKMMDMECFYEEAILIQSLKISYQITVIQEYY